MHNPNDPLPRNPREPRLIDEEDLLKLKSLVNLLEEGWELGLSGAPFSSLGKVLSDICLRLSQTLFSSFLFPENNPGLKFEENKKEPEAEMDREHVFRDPVSGEFYSFQSDSLSNPLQVEIEFPPVNFNERDRRTLRQFFEDLAQVLSFISSGRIDWRFIKNLRRFQGGKQVASSKAIQKQNNGKNYHYYRRNKQKGSPKRK